MTNEETIDEMFERYYEKLKKEKSNAIMECILIPKFDTDEVKWFMNNSRVEALANVEKIIDEDKIYPKDIFPEISPKRLQEVNGFLKVNFGFPLDRLSAHISRKVLIGIKAKLKETI